MRKYVLQLLENYIISKEYENMLKINDMADIPIDSKVEDGQGVLYVRKVPTAFINRFNFYNPIERYKVGLRTSYPHTELNVVKGEEIIKDLQKYFWYNISLCEVSTNVTNDYSNVSKDNLERYFWEFEIEIKKF